MLRCRRTPRPVPDHYCCKISMELMLDPVRCYTRLGAPLPPPLPLRRRPPHPHIHPPTRPPLLKVTTPCGISYERACLRDHLSRLRGRGEVGLEPTSRKPHLTLTP
jgi:hypothetical protein